LRVNSIAALLVLLAATGHATVVTSFNLGYRGEPGVESKMLAAVQADMEPVCWLKVDAGLSCNLFENNGLGAAGVGIGAVLSRPAGLAFRLAGQHQQWNDWRAGENRLLATLEAGPLFGFDAGLGLVRRVPVFGDRYWSPLAWSGGAAEWNYLYRLRWKFVDKANWWLRAGFSSYDRFTAHNPQQFPFEADGGYRLKDGLELIARVSSAIVGFSGGLPSFHELELSAGVKHGF
jgi:hypothetical protein